MNKKTLENAVSEAKRFIKVAQALDDRLDENLLVFLGCKESSACRRASMDLTRALAELRKPG